MSTTELMIDALQDALDTLKHLKSIGVTFDHDDEATVARIEAALAAAGVPVEAV